MTPFYQAMQEVLQKPQYDILTGRSVDYRQLIADAINHAIINFLEQLFLRMPDAPEYNLGAITNVFIIATALLLLGAMIGIVYIILKYKGQNAAKEMSLAAVFDDISNKRFTLGDLLRLSREYAEKNQFRDAVRHYYIAVLVALHDKKTIQVDKSKTNAQLTRELALAAPILSDPFVSVVNVFQETWFGRRSVDASQYHHFTVNAEEILHEK